MRTVFQCSVAPTHRTVVSFLSSLVLCLVLAAFQGLRATSRLGLATSPGRFASTLVVADAESSSISGGSLSSITAAKKLGGNVRLKYVDCGSAW